MSAPCELDVHADSVSRKSLFRYQSVRVLYSSLYEAQ